MQLDEVDQRILRKLMKDARTPFTEIAKDLGVSDATIHVRVNKLLDSNIIRRYTIDVDERVLGRRVGGFVLINVKPGFLKDVAKDLLGKKEITEICEIHGRSDLIVKVAAKNIPGLRELLLKIRDIPNIEDTELLTILKSWRENDS